VQHGTVHLSTLMCFPSVASKVISSDKIQLSFACHNNIINNNGATDINILLCVLVTTSSMVP